MSATKKGMLDLTPEQVVAPEDELPEFNAQTYVQTLAAYKGRAERAETEAARLKAENESLEAMKLHGFYLAIRDNPELVEVDLGAVDQSRDQRAVNLILKPSAAQVFVSASQFNSIFKQGHAPTIADVMRQLGDEFAKALTEQIPKRITGSKR